MELVTLCYLVKDGMRDATLVNNIHPKTLKTVLKAIEKHNISDYVLIKNDLKTEMFKTTELLNQVQVCIDQGKENVRLQPVSSQPFLSEDEENILA